MPEKVSINLWIIFFDRHPTRYLLTILILTVDYIRLFYELLSRKRSILRLRDIREAV